MKKRVRFSFRATTKDNRSIREGYLDSGHKAGFSAYVRDVLSGTIPHPNFDPRYIETNIFRDESDVGKLKSPDEIRHHYQAVVLAMGMFRLKSDPELRKYIDADPEGFEKLVRQIRGYQFDDRTGIKSPLPKKIQRQNKSKQ